ncbi:MAG: glycosyltransferase family 2 protein [Bacteroidales bacterium]|nr:glycosyltransferase family 2 protein [Bacteroidales bacterium]
MSKEFNNYNYSIIIPHYNCPELLMRLLRSIPIRSDVQVIVVDDHSIGGEMYQSVYPELSRPFLEYTRADRHGGAGYARNIGMTMANGKWMVFADSDDVFDEEAFEAFDRHIDSDADIIYFRVRQVLSEDLTARSDRLPVLDELFLSQNEQEFRLRYIFPWGKMLRKDFVKGNGFIFEEVMFGNDLVFGIKTGCSAKKIQICPDPVYHLTQREGSLTYTLDQKEGELECRLIENIKALRIARDYGYKKSNSSVAYRLQLLRREDKEGYKRCKRVASDLGILWFPLLIKGIVTRWKQIAKSS